VLTLNRKYPQWNWKLAAANRGALTSINIDTLIDGALGTGDVNLAASGVHLTPQSGVLTNYIADNATLSFVSGATTILFSS
jgi:hypothetical protein